MISLAQPLPIGNAVRLILEPPAGTDACRVLRKGSGTFTGHEDANAAVVFDGGTDNLSVLVDTLALTNDVMVFYCPFYSSDGGANWVAGTVVSATPRATYEDQCADVMTLVRDRLEAGLKVEVERGVITHGLDYVQVFTAPPIAEETHFPAVTIHLESEQSSERAIGEYIGGDAFNANAFDWDETDGWIADIRLQIIGWSLNADERMDLRKAIRRVVVANMLVFAAAGMDHIDLEQSDVDSLSGEYGVAQLFQTVNLLTCQAPVRVGGKVGAVSDVIVNARSTTNA